MFKLSKTNYMKGVQCKKALWLQKFDRDKATPIDANTQKLFDDGHAVGKLAQKLYPNGKGIPFNTQPYAKKFELTADYVKNGEHTIYEATIQSSDMMCMVDILHKGENGWEVIEVKSSMSLKDEHIKDVGVQFHIAKEAGLPVTKARLIHINPDYILQDYLNLDEYFVSHDITEAVLAEEDTILRAKKELNAVNKFQLPEESIGPHCIRPHTCNFKDYCWSELPEHSCLSLAGMPFDERFELFFKGQIRFEDLAITDLPDYANEQVSCELNKQHIVKQEPLKKFLKTLFYPMAFFDFETINPIIPKWHHTYSRQQIPFQFSCHVMNSPFDIPSHHEFIGNGTDDPRLELIQKMIKVIPKNSCILVYNEDFEKKVIEDLAMAYPEFHDELMTRHANIRDLMIPFKERHIYSHHLAGRYSIKKILPLLCPELTYDTLEIQDGLQALNDYLKLETINDEHSKTQIVQELLAYCKLDTFAMIEILKQVERIAQTPEYLESLLVNLVPE